ncbi:MAG TPA: hypothetical protein VIV35_01595 [Chitinophagaceae bacterium]
MNNQKRNLLMDSLGRITFSVYLYSEYTGMSEKIMMSNMATAFNFNLNNYYSAI